MKNIIISIIGLVIAQACVAKPYSHVDKSPKDNYSITDIKHSRENLFAKKLKELKKKNPTRDAYFSISKGKYYLMSYRSGRASRHKVPGLTSEQIATNHCEYQTILGLGDSIYGKNHQKYRIAIRKYASEFNKIMFPYCE